LASEEKDPVVYSGRVHVKPGDGRTVRSPDHGKQNLPAKGDWVEWSVYWERRRLDGDVVVSDPQPDPDAQDVPAAPPAPPAPPPPPPAPALKAPKTDNDKDN
jgi:hypothetical protein